MEKREYKIGMSKFKLCIFSLLALVLIAGTAFAQAPTGKIIGKVMDDQNVPLPGVNVEATSPRLVGSASTVTDAEGVFRLFALPSGTYTVKFSLDGFNTYVRQDIFLQLEQTINVNVTMKPSTLEEEVTVVGLSPIIDVKSTVKGKTLTREMFMSLPKGRDFTGLISIIPGVHYESNTGGLSVDGATGTENMWYVDGTDTTNMHIGTQAQNAVFELVDEVQVKASGYSAEFGGSMGGVVNVITRSGGNAFHGDVVAYYDNNTLLMQGKTRDHARIDPYDYYRAEYVNNDDLYFNGGKDRDPYHRYEGIFSLGGYIIKDRLWFFGSFNPILRTDSWDRYHLDYTDPDQIFTYKRTRKNWNGQFKLTAQPFGGLRVSASFVNNYYTYRGAAPSIAGTSTYDYDWEGEGFDYPNWSANMTMDYIMGNNLLFSLRGGYFFTDTTNQQITAPGTVYRFYRSNYIYDDVIPANLLHYSGWWSYPGSDYVLKSHVRDRISANFDITYYAYLGGEHSFKPVCSLSASTRMRIIPPPHPAPTSTGDRAITAWPRASPYGGPTATTSSAATISHPTATTGTSIPTTGPCICRTAGPSAIV